MIILGEVEYCNQKQVFLCHNRDILDSLVINNDQFVFKIEEVKYKDYDIYIREDNFFLPMPVKAHKGIVTMRIDYEKCHPMAPVYKTIVD